MYWLNTPLIGLMIVATIESLLIGPDDACDT
jgi:hypothetical protein